MSLRDACARCASVCFERNPVIARMLGLCPLLAITDSAFDGLVFGGFFCVVLCATSLVASFTRNLLVRPLRPLFAQLIAAVCVAALGGAGLVFFHATFAPWGVYLALVAANCLLLDHAHGQAAWPRPKLARDLALTVAAVWAGVLAFGALRGLLAGPLPGFTAGLMPLAGSPAGALILLGLLAAGANALRQPAAADAATASVASR